MYLLWNVISIIYALRYISFDEHKIYLSILNSFLVNLTVKFQPIEILFNFWITENIS